MNIADKTVLITGSTDGVGKVVAQRLASQGAQVLLHGRSAEKGERVRAEIARATGSTRLAYYNADLSSLDEVRALAGRVAADHARLDILINNAGVGRGAPDQQSRALSRDGHELRFAVNYLACFLLTQLLLPKLRASAPARIVHVASAGQQAIDFDDVMLARGYSGVRAYRQSKLAQVMHAVELTQRLAGSGVTVNALHPATFMNTNMVIQAGNTPLNDVAVGADAILNLATSPALEGRSGLYFDVQREVRADPQAYDAVARGQLWDLSVKLTGVEAS
jgi:NAD(P)-dependent dehydrogenase (short-subunit alcohol dehydrogenase family)